jgi:hypothetical protein
MTPKDINTLKKTARVILVRFDMTHATITTKTMRVHNATQDHQLDTPRCTITSHILETMGVSSGFRHRLDTPVHINTIRKTPKVHWVTQALSNMLKDSNTHRKTLRFIHLQFGTTIDSNTTRKKARL